MWIVDQGQRNCARGKDACHLEGLSLILRMHAGEGKNYLLKVVFRPQCVLLCAITSSPAHTSKYRNSSLIKHKQFSTSILITKIHIQNTKPKRPLYQVFVSGWLCVLVLCVGCVYSMCFHMTPSLLTLSRVLRGGKQLFN